MTVVSEPHQEDFAAGDGDPIYAYKPSLIGMPSEFVLKRDALHWQIGGRAGRIRYDRVRAVRMSFRPVTMQSHRFLTEIWSADNPKIQIASASWRSPVDQQRLDAPYRAFVTELNRRLAAAGSTAKFSVGSPPVIYWPGAAVFVALMLAMAVLLVHALWLKEWTGAAIVALFFVVFAYQLGNFFRRNRPASYRPDAIPEQVLPRG